MRKFQSLLLVLSLSAALLGLFSCSDVNGEDETGTVSLKITDAPLVGEEIEEVHAAVTGVDIHTPGGWVTLIDLGDESEDVELLALAGGITADMGEFPVSSGKVTQIRVFLDEDDCFLLKKDDETEYPLQVSSSGGFKAVGAFEVPVNDTLELILDIDVQKSLGKNSQGYYLKPAMRIIAEDISGMISGTITDTTADLTGRDLSVYAYEAGSYESTEADLSVNGLYFENAVSSAMVTECPAESAWTYKLAFLSVNYTYDLVLVEWDGAVPTVLEESAAAGVTVTAKGNTKADISF